MKKDLRKTVLTGIGIALFTVLTLCLQVPVFQNYYLCLGYVAMAAYCYILGAFCSRSCGGFFLFTAARDKCQRKSKI